MSIVLFVSGLIHLYRHTPVILKNNEDWLKKHFEDHHKNQKCTKCDFQTESSDSLKKHLDQVHERETTDNKEQNIPITVIRCLKCDFQNKSNDLMKKHMELVHEEKSKDSEFNCTGCDYQGTEERQLQKHIYLKHTLEGRLQENKFVCNNCGDKFPGKMNLLSHRKSRHGETVAVCRKYLEGRCHFSSEKCWWNHKDKDQTKGTSVSCYVCSEMFETKTKMMVHRKSTHRELVSTCKNFLRNDCMFADKACWFLHEEEEMEIEEGIQKENDKKDNHNKTESVFQKVFENIRPPIVEK